ncbi:nuclear transport factor 2 family protein [Thalassospira sp. NFXS8]|uniref:nuclear transport factor 2 family protein n=1 Tax=Thalassospira sp. NFXS8 TaxID=2819093 RepID=UPI0032DF0DBA
MTVLLPAAIAGFFDQCTARNFAGVCTCFSPDAHVYDEKQNINGHAAIEKWITHAIGSTDAVHVVTSATALPDTPAANRQSLADITDGQLRVTADVSGNFKGSPVNLTYLFTLHDGKITALEIG